MEVNSRLSRARIASNVFLQKRSIRLIGSLGSEGNIKNNNLISPLTHFLTQSPSKNFMLHYSLNIPNNHTNNNQHPIKSILQIIKKLSINTKLKNNKQSRKKSKKKFSRKKCINKKLKKDNLL